MRRQTEGLLERPGEMKWGQLGNGGERIGSNFPVEVGVDISRNQRDRTWRQSPAGAAGKLQLLPSVTEGRDPGPEMVDTIQHEPPAPERRVGRGNQYIPRVPLTCEPDGDIVRAGA